MPREGGYYDKFGFSMPGLVQNTTGGGQLPSDVACPAATNTTVFISPSQAMPDDGVWQLWAMGFLVISCGGTPPTAITLPQQGGGDPAIVVPTQLLVANANIMVPLIWMLGSGRIVNGQNFNSTPVNVNPTAQAVTTRQNSRVSWRWERLSD